MSEVSHLAVMRMLALDDNSPRAFLRQRERWPRHLQIFSRDIKSKLVCEGNTAKMPDNRQAKAQIRPQGHDSHQETHTAGKTGDEAACTL